MAIRRVNEMFFFIFVKSPQIIIIIYYTLQTTVTNRYGKNFRYIGILVCTFVRNVRNVIVIYLKKKKRHTYNHICLYGCKVYRTKSVVIQLQVKYLSTRLSVWACVLRRFFYWNLCLNGSKKRSYEERLTSNLLIHCLPMNEVRLVHFCCMQMDRARQA